MSTCSKSSSLRSSMNWSLFVLINLSSCCVVTSVSMSSSPPSITTICWQVWGFFFDGELVSFGLNWSLGVDGSICTFTCCDCKTSHGDMLVEHFDRHELMNCSMVTTLREVSLDYSTTIFSSLPLTTYGLGKSMGVSSFDKGN